MAKNNPNKPSKENQPRKTSRREFLHKLGAILGGAAGAAGCGTTRMPRAYEPPEAVKDLFIEPGGVKPPYTIPEEAVDIGLETASEWTEPEVRLLADSYDHIASAYINPSLWIYLHKTGKEKEVYKMLEAVLKNPDQFHYEKEEDGVKITPRPSAEGENLPTITLHNGRVSHVNKIRVDSHGYDDWTEFEKEIAEINRKLIANMGINASRKDWELFEAYTLRLPHKFKDLIEIKNEALESNSGLRAIISLIEKQPETMKEMQEKPVTIHIGTLPNNPHKIFFFKVPDPENPDETKEIVFAIDNRSGQPLKKEGEDDETYLPIYKLPEESKDAIFEKWKKELLETEAE